jgi:hypothetical protein
MDSPCGCPLGSESTCRVPEPSEVDVGTPGPQSDAAARPPARAGRWVGPAVMIVLGALAVGASALLVRFQAQQLHAEEQALWETRLLEAARQQRDFLQESGTADLEAVAAIPESPTIGLFLTEYQAQRGDFDRIMDGVEQLDYIRNYLTVVASRHGYQTGAPAMVPVNLPETVQAVDAAAVVDAEAMVDTTDLILREFAFEGIALVNLSGDVIVATDEFPPLTYAIREFITTAPRGERHVTIGFDAPDGRPLHVSLHPAYAYLELNEPERQLAWIVGLRLLEEVYDTTLLVRRGFGTDGVSFVAVHRTEEGLRALSRVDEETPGGALVMTAEEAPDWALALDRPGTAALVTRPDGQALLTGSAAFDDVPVSIVASVTAGEAFASVDRAAAVAYWQLVPVALLGVAGVGVALWMGRSRKRLIVQD